MKIVELSGGVGGALMARGLSMLDDGHLTVVVNVGDDETIHGFHISPDLDTVVYTLAGREGPAGWGRGSDTFNFNEELARFGIDNTFQLGDKDLALKLYRSRRLEAGDQLSAITADVAKAFGVAASLSPSTDHKLRTELLVDDGGWISFQDYFVKRSHKDEVRELRFVGAETAAPAPGVIDAIASSDILVIGPSNPPLSIWPILAVPGIREAVASHPRTVCVSPLFSGKALRGPAHHVLSSLGLQPGNRGIVEAYEGLVNTLVVDTRDAGDADELAGVEVIVEDTLIKEPQAAAELALKIVGR